MLLHRHLRILFATAFVLAGCLGDVGHENPLDPESDGFDPVGAVQLTVTGFYPPFEPVEGAEIEFRLLEAGATKRLVRTERTGASGFVQAGNLAEGSYEISVGKEGYSTRLDTVAVEIAGLASLTVRLDGLPGLQSGAVSTVHVSRWFPQPQDLYSLEIDVVISDPDGVADLDSIWLDIPSYSISRSLLPTPEPGRFEHAISESALGGPSIQQLLGAELFIRAVDRAGFENEAAARRLVRVIETTPVALSPQGEALLTETTPELVWENARLPFPFTYRVDVVREETNVQVTVETLGGLPVSTTAIRPSNALPPGDYFWTISVVDAFGNRSRSKEAGFRIQ